MLSDAIYVAHIVAGILSQLQIPYWIGGSLASSIHGVPRSTHDIDFVAIVEEKHIALLVAAMEADFYIDGEMIRDAIETHTSFNVVHLPTMYKVDVFVPAMDARTLEEMQRRRSKQVESGTNAFALYFAGTEDTILQKLRWYRLGGGVSDRQWSDVTGVLKINAETLDYDYLRRWAATLGLSDLLSQAMQEAGIEAGGQEPS